MSSILLFYGLCCIILRRTIMSDMLGNNRDNEMQFAKKNGKRKIIIFLIAAVVLVPVLVWGTKYAVSINDLANPGKNILKNNPLDNPVVMKVAESLPIPKITLSPVTPVPANPMQTPIDIDSNLENSGQETVNSDELVEAFDAKSTIYTNNDLGFSINYPADYKLEENSYGLGVLQVNFVSPNNNDPVNYPDMQMLVYPSQIGKLIGQDFDKLYSMEENSTQRMSSETIEPRLFTLVKKKNVGGNKAFDFMTTDDPPDVNKEAETGTYIYANDIIFIISAGESGKSLLDRMILTFKKI